MINSSTLKNSVNFLHVKYELFDHLIYPLSIKIDDNSIIQLFRKLHIMSSIDYKITYKEWIDQSLLNLNQFTETEAKILFTTYKIYANEFEQIKNISNKNNDTVDVRFFGLFFALQLFNQRSKMNIDNTIDKNPYSMNNFNSNINNYTSPLSSPRGKGSISNRAVTSQMEYQNILNFIKSNLKLFLRLIASDIHNTETSLNSNEFNTLKFFFKFNSNNSNNINNLSQIAPFFMNFSTTTKINIDIINEWLTTSIYQFPTNLNQSNIDIFDDLIQLKNLSKCVTIKENLQNKNVKISQCEDSFIFINSNVNSVKISNCINCTIVIASVSKITSIDKCENVQITTATNLIRVSNTIDSKIFSYSINEPILFGDNRAIILAPHNVYYSELLTHLKVAKFPQISSQFILNFSNPISINQGDFQIMQPKDFNITIVPFTQDRSGYVPLAPKEYVEVIKQRDLSFVNIKKMIDQAELQEEQEKALHVAIQGYFREYLVSSGNIKPMTDIVKMIDFSRRDDENN